MTRVEFPESVKRAALERAGWRCQDPLCGVSPEWAALQTELAASGIEGTLLHPLPDALLLQMRDTILAARFTMPRALKPIIRKFKLDGGALLEVDHERECADGGAATVDNAIVRCVFCHFFKTQARARSRRAAPKKAARGTGGDAHPTRKVEQTNLITRATVLGLQGKIDGKLAAGRLRVRESARSPSGDAGIIDSHTPPSAPREHGAVQAPKERRHFTDAQVVEAIQRRQREAEDNWFGV